MRGKDQAWREDRSPVQTLRPTIWIGKQGVTDTLIAEIRVQMKKRHIVKVKWLQHADIDPGEVARAAGVDLVAVRGRIMVLAEKKK